ncbi:MAG: hypothetical protein U0929_07850 [Planctomycetaceae bacterium]
MRYGKFGATHWSSRTPAEERVVDWRKLWKPARTGLQQFWGIEWSTEGLIGAALRLDGGRVVIEKNFSIPFTSERSIEASAAEIVAELATKTAALGPNSPCVVVVPREAVVIRQLQLPNVPDDELPTLVRFQAAAKSSTPTASIAVDYIPLGSTGDGQAVLAAMLDSNRVQKMRDLLTRAQLQLVSLEVSPFLIAELVAREEEQGGTPDIPTLIVAQTGDRVEISILDRRRLIASHAVWLPEGDAARHVSPLQTEINRCLISLSQSHPGVEIDQVYLIEDEHADEAVERMLQERFGEKTHPLNLGLLGTDIPADHRLAYLALIARGLTGKSGIVPRVDLVNSRKPAEKVDNTRRNLIAAGTAAVALIGGAWWNFSSQMAELDSEIKILQTEITSYKGDLGNGKSDLAAAEILMNWGEGDQDTLATWDHFHQLLPGTDRLYLVDLKSIPSSGARQTRITGTARARTQDDVENFLQRMADAGWLVKPISPLENKKDPDYPWQFAIDAEQPRVEPVKPAPSAPASPKPVASTTSESPNR